MEERLTTLTLTDSERELIAQGLVCLARLADAVNKPAEAKTALVLWERVVPETVA